MPRGHDSADDEPAPSAATTITIATKLMTIATSLTIHNVADDTTTLTIHNIDHDSQRHDVVTQRFALPERSVYPSSANGRSARTQAGALWHG
jgi:hypothetical protein